MHRNVMKDLMKPINIINKIINKTTFKVLKIKKYFMVIFLIGLMPYCANTLLTSEGYPGKPPESNDAQGSQITKETIATGVYKIKVNATSQVDWIYFDLETGTQLDVTQPMVNSQWDMSFQRFKIKINGGNSGSAGNALQPLKGQDFDTLTSPPNSFTPNITDRADSGSGTDACRPGINNTLFAYLDSTFTGNACWFRYAARRLTPRDIVYVHKTGDGNYYKVKVVNYYSDTGTSGNITFKYSQVSAP